MSQRHIMRIDLTAQAKQKVERLSEQHGMTQVAIMSRMIEWLAQQTPETQKTIMMEQPGDRGAALMSLRRMAAS